MKHKRNLIIGIVLSATAGFIALQSANAPAPADEILDAPTAFESEFPPSEIDTPSEESCYYVWAYRDADELTKKLGVMVKSINQNADINATLFGEDCIYADGRSTFSVMQTDFYFRLPVDNSTNDTVLGNWMAMVLDEIIRLPREELTGNYGFVEFWFEKTDSIFVRVPIQRYLDEGREKRGAELFRMFYTPP
jgi:hypothetical protein